MTVAETTRKVRRRLNKYEARYEMTSEQMWADLQLGRIRETAEIAAWVVQWRAYQRLTGEVAA